MPRKTKQRHKHGDIDIERRETKCLPNHFLILYVLGWIYAACLAWEDILRTPIGLMRTPESSSAD